MQLERRGSVLPSKVHDVSRNLRLVFYRVSDFLQSLHPVETVRGWCFAFRSFRAHIRIQRATRGSLLVGPSLVQRGEYYRVNERTQARVAGIEKLRANFPWAGLPHFQMFLAGFDEGERYGMAICHHQNNPDQSQIQTEPLDSSSSLHTRATGDTCLPEHRSNTHSLQN